MADTVRQPIQSRAVPIVPQPADPVTTCLAPSTSAMTSSPSSASVPVTAPMCHDAPSLAFDNQPLVADCSSLNIWILPPLWLMYHQSFPLHLMALINLLLINILPLSSIQPL
ncbi:hypothetical protein V6N11_054577 [Hibiscus sabdariffa]|uniref:Uncharacterized protein n=1 Tax=Hibiscus sabdariffa TaxID=183260 RepID=A0ABR2S4I1_9ROSI